jgi:hypothetical protein
MECEILKSAFLTKESNCDSIFTVGKWKFILSRFCVQWRDMAGEVFIALYKTLSYGFRKNVKYQEVR